MKIYTMTATFGKLEHATLDLKPGLNIIHAPNEWGKSTWCAFLIAMLYGIETRVHTTKTALADKEHYAPWSGSPMAGRIDLCWEGRDITVERSSKGRGVFNVFRAYETQTGLEIPELRADNCGQLLLGVEKSVFLRAGFLKLTDMPVTQDEALRRRLNALVTTGDESGTADTLAIKLKALKNSCQSNSVTGLLPQARQQRAALESKLNQLHDLQEQSRRITQRQQELEDYHRQLQNHQAALAYASSRTYAQKLAQAKEQEAQALMQLELAQARCAGLPAADVTEGKLLRLDQLQSAMNALQMDAQLLPEAPMAPVLQDAFRDWETVNIRQHAATDEAVHAQAMEEAKQKKALFLGLALGILSFGLLLIPHWAGILGAVLGVLTGTILSCANIAGRKRAAATAQALEARYRPLAPGTWAAAAEKALAEQTQYRQAMAEYTREREALASRAQALKQENEELTGGQPLAQCRQQWLDARNSWLALSDARKEHYRAAQLTQALSATHREVAPAAQPDHLTHTEAETARLLSDCALEQRQLHERLGHCRAGMDALGTRQALEAQLEAVNRRIDALEDTLAALELAQLTLTRAAAELQRRFAPRISQRAQEIFAQLTQGRYHRLTLADDLTVYTGAETETTTHSALWRSDGTVDQLYLALRLAVSEALTPEAPLFLDDALVRFDDQRLAQAMTVLQEAAADKQVILFSCQSREAALCPERVVPV